MKNSTDYPIILLASERSGSNLIRTLISNHSGIAAPRSPHFLNVFHQIIVYYGDLSKKENCRNLFNDMLRLANHPYHKWDLQLEFDKCYDAFHPKSFLDIFDLLYKSATEKENKRRYFIKEVNTFHHAFELYNYFDKKAHFIYLYRDPRDHVASWLRDPLHLKNAKEAAEKWKKEQLMCQVLIHTFKLPVCHLKYEDLISNTETEVTRVLNYLGEEVEPACFQTTKKDKTEWNVYWKNLQNPIMADNQNKYLKELHAEELRIVQNITKEEMNFLGYDAANVPEGLPQKRSLINRLSGKKKNSGRELPSLEQNLQDKPLLREKLELVREIKREAKKSASNSSKIA
jgi:hypothetical protein